MNQEKKLKQELMQGHNSYFMKTDAKEMLEAQLLQSKKIARLDTGVYKIYDKKTDTTSKRIAFSYLNMDSSIKIKIYNLKSNFLNIQFEYLLCNLFEMCCLCLLAGKSIEYEENAIIMPFQWFIVSKFMIAETYQKNTIFWFEIDKKTIDCDKIEILYEHREMDFEKNRFVYGMRNPEKNLTQILDYAQKISFNTNHIYVTNVKQKLDKYWSVIEVNVFENIPERLKAHILKKKDLTIYILNNLELTDLDSLQKYLKEINICIYFAMKNID